MKIKNILYSIVILFFVFTSHSFAQYGSGIILSPYANLRTQPSVTGSSVVAKIYKGTAVKVIEKNPEKIKIGAIEGQWVKVEILDSGQTGWLFDQYIALEGDPQIQAYIQSVLSSLYYYRENIGEQVSEIKKMLGKKTALEKMKNYNPRFLNYVGYYLLAEKNPLAFPALITFMDPTYQEENSKDANYNFTWELLARITPRSFVTNTYKTYSLWWQKNHESAQIDIHWYEIANIFRKIQDNENKVYRKLLDS